jgi:2'-5' RNA ligase
VEAGDRLRLFCALCLPGDLLDQVTEFQHALSQLGKLGGGDGRIVPRANLHVTLAFLGSQAAGDVAAIAAALRSACSSAAPPRLHLRGYRETRSVGMLTFDDEGGRAAAIAARLHEALEALGVYRREERPWLAHLTVLRFRHRPRLRPELPQLAPVVPSDAAVFISRLRPSGAVYEAVEVVALGG